ncbi:UVR8 [Symbiodinium pilosum]|uniref:UVR8 protein n=1 Tax=Symbiodinium pilosum TaxID=2952 RepID=A0A812NYE4_SYMPI|nr:UVR8 [Symbiodinium pilosum]
MGDDLPAVDVGSNRKVIKLVVGALHTCGILDDQSLKCWGYGANHRLGFLPNVYGDNNGNAGDSPNEMGNYLPSVDFGSRPVLDADAGAISTCAIIEDPTDGRQVTCFGFNFEGVLGRGITDVDSSAGGVYMPVNLGTGLYPVQVAIGNDHTCTLLSSGAVKCWGRSQFGQLGIGTTLSTGNGPNDMGDNLPVVNLGTDQGAPLKSIYIGAGAYHTCAILETGGVKCWGYNPQGQAQPDLLPDQAVGDALNELGDNLPTIDLGPGRTAVAVAPGDGHTCARLDNSAVHCWGNTQDFASFDV